MLKLAKYAAITAAAGVLGFTATMPASAWGYGYGDDAYGYTYPRGHYSYYWPHHRPHYYGYDGYGPFYGSRFYRDRGW
jgi:hypothetical protein